MISPSEPKPTDNNDTMNLDLPNLDDLPTLDDSDRWNEFLDSLANARERREELRQRADEVEVQIATLEEEIPEIRVAVATGDATEEELEEAKQELADLEEELTDLRENEIPGAEETVQLLRDRRDQIKTEEGAAIAEAYAEAQATLQKQKRELLEGLAQVLEALDEFQSKKKTNSVGESYSEDAPNVPPIHPTIRGRGRGDRVEPQRLRRQADEVASALETLDAE
jgi:chromosome segregation ATPase